MRGPRLLGLGVLLVVAACSANPAPPAPTLSEPPIVVRTIGHPDQVIRPLDSVRLPPDVIVRVARAQTRDLNACLEEKGDAGDAVLDKDIQAAVGDPVRYEAQASPLWGFFGTQPQVSGFRLAIAVGGGTLPGSSDPVHFYECFERARTQTPGGHAWMEFTTPSGLPLGGPMVPASDSRFVAAVAQWAQCLADRGFTAQDPPGFVNRNSAGPDPVTPAEISAATADIECKLTTNLVGIGLAVQSAYDRIYMDDNAAALVDWRAQIDAYVR